jgi:hypothetical protein
MKKKKTLNVPQNPFRPGAGQKPLYLAGRTHEQDQFQTMLFQTPVAQNLILTGLRGVGKTVLLEELKPIAQRSQWLWTGNDLSESTSLSEERVARRLIVDLSTLLAPILHYSEQERLRAGFLASSATNKRQLEFNDLWSLFERTPGNTDDKLKAVLSTVRKAMEKSELRGIVFAYDEAQNLADHAQTKEFPLSLLLDVFAYFQRQPSNFSFMLALTGLPTLFPKLNEARTYTERMFHVMHLHRLHESAAREAIVKPIEMTKSTLEFSDRTIQTILSLSGGYPYFIQFISKEVFDAWIGKIVVGQAPSVPIAEIEEKLDEDFFAPRWSRATDRQQDFMRVVATLRNAEDEFTVQEIVAASRKTLIKGFSPSHATQMLKALAEKGLMYRSRYGGYCFAVPLLARFINRQGWDEATGLPTGLPGT